MIPAVSSSEFRFRAEKTDLDKVRGNTTGFGASAQVIPEPTAVFLFVGGALAVATRLRRRAAR